MVLNWETCFNSILEFLVAILCLSHFITECPGFGNYFNLRKLSTMNFEVASTWIVNIFQHHMFQKAILIHKNIFPISQIEQILLFLACQNVTSMEMAWRVWNLYFQICKYLGLKISLKISRPIQVQIHQYYLNEISLPTFSIYSKKN